MLIDCSYFTKGPRQVYNATLGAMPNANGVEVNAKISSYIEEHQEHYLKRMLGDRLGNKVHSYLVCVDEDSDAGRNAAMEAVCDQLRQSFADYVFYQILRDSASRVTITGVVRLKSANEYVSPRSRQVSVWNSMVDRNREFAEWAASTDCPIGGVSPSSDMVTKINTLNL